MQSTDAVVYRKQKNNLFHYFTGNDVSSEQ